MFLGALLRGLDGKVIIRAKVTVGDFFKAVFFRPVYWLRYTLFVHVSV